MNPIDSLQQKIMQDIPFTQHMGISFSEYSNDSLRLDAELAKNINHRKTAFGGIITSLGTLACWGLIYLQLQQRDLKSRIVIQKGATEYLQPIDNDFYAIGTITETKKFEQFITMLTKKHIARIKLEASIYCANNLAARFEGTFVARR